MIIRKQWGYFWNPDHQVAELISSILPLAAVFQLSDAISAVSGGILRGLGHQKFGAYINLFGYYGLGLPIGLFLTFPPNDWFQGWDLYGLWTGLTVALMTVSIVQVLMIVRVNWAEESENARIRVNEDRYRHVEEEEERLIQEE